MKENLPAEILAARAVAERLLSTLGGCALLIGVEDYPELPGQALLAGRNDVLAYWKVCRRLGYKAEHIRVRTSPVLTSADILQAETELALGRRRNRGKPREEVLALVSEELTLVPWGQVLGEADHASIVDGVKWLSEKLVSDFRAEWEGQRVHEEMAALPGMLAYSGHGAQLLGDLALCPSDVKRSDDGRGLDNALAFADLRRLLDAGDRIEGGYAPTDNLTVVLDCCFAAAGADNESMLASSLTLAGTPSRPPAAEIGSRVFCASARDEQAFQALLGGRWQGAFTWAFTRALEQWKTAASGHFKKSTISHAELLFRARMLLEALSFPQHPVLVDKIANLPVFWHGSDVEGRRETKTEPDAERHGIQLDPSYKSYSEYTLLDASGQVLATIIVPASDQPGVNSGFKKFTEYWFVSHSFNTMGASGWKLKKDERWWNDPLPLTASGASFTRQMDANWVADSSTADVCGNYNSGSTSLSFGLTADVIKKQDATVTVKMLKWHRSSTQSLLFQNLSGPFPKTFMLDGTPEHALTSSYSDKT